MHTMQYSTAIRWVNQMCMYWPGKMSMALNEKKKVRYRVTCRSWYHIHFFKKLYYVILTFLGIPVYIFNFQGVSEYT